MKTKVMLIDDDKEFLEEMNEMLLLSGYEVVCIDDAKKAACATLEHEPDVILLDLKMPDKSGFEVADELRYLSGACGAPIIVMTAYFKDELQPLLNLCGVRKCLKKPLHPLDVISQIEEAVAGR
ncbi:MAG TPA: hypothetical protein DCL35_05960 [Candidatus Omnitrophica bacterium]|nr:hypothetical protein [Candidatus Omnitrophota bacterium]